MVHAPAAEKKAVQEGWAIDRTLIGSNEFFMVGPASDPAKIAAAQERPGRLPPHRRGQGQVFFPGGQFRHPQKRTPDLAGGRHPAPGRLVHRHQGFHDRHPETGRSGTGLLHGGQQHLGGGEEGGPNLKVLYKGDKLLVNTYNALAQPAGATPGAALAAKFIAFVASPQGQQIIKDYGQDRYGEGLYNDAAYARQYEK